jgi:hypothetical protein
LKKTTAAIAIAALAVPAAAQADKPQDAGSKGREKAQQQQSKRHGHGKKSDRFRGVGFTLRGVDYKGATPTTESRASQTLSEFSLDVTGANRHAYRYLGLTDRPSKREPAQDKSIKDTFDGKASVRLVGFEQGEQPDSDDRVKVIGRVTRTRKGDSDSGSTTTSAPSERKLDIRRIVIKDADTTEAEKQQAEQEKAEREKAEQDD